VIVTDAAVKIKQLVSYYIRKCGTSDPFELADKLSILYQSGKCGYEGYYIFLKNHRYIFLSDDLNEADQRLVMAHELRHAILDRKDNCYFIRNKTFLLNSKIERRANRFAAELLIPDEVILENVHLTTRQLSRLLGYEQKFIELRLESYYEI